MNSYTYRSLTPEEKLTGMECQTFLANSMKCRKPASRVITETDSKENDYSSLYCEMHFQLTLAEISSPSAYDGFNTPAIINKDEETDPSTQKTLNNSTGSTTAKAIDATSENKNS
jgi:hypothetical protein